ncbi:MAG: bifunctional adenosylcobinamide kinase/adenosylcobinamide-phosphate guanylyltransferase [Nitrospirales bacterium]|nr:bifunctional adenosylcobinamide kinase/adenosylcobinamide-phosphate guanylyltransferase [Nitrospirales bacterium]
MSGGEVITFIIGGARSGKSGFALKLADSFVCGVKERGTDSPARKAYIATAQALDEEMGERIRKHREERSAGWETLEEPMDIGRLIRDIHPFYDVILLDCLTLWATNILLAEKPVKEETEILLSSLGPLVGDESSSLLIVSNEVGMGIVPDNPLSRRFRDLAGSLNQRMAEMADRVYLVAAGIPIQIK